MKRIIFQSLFIFYIIITIFVTICLLAYNDYKVSEFGNVSFVILEKKIDNYDKNDFLIISKNNIDELKKGDEVFYYELKNSDADVAKGEISGIDRVNKNEYILNFADGNYVSTDYYIGDVDDTLNLGFLGIFLGALKSKIGYLIVIVLPIFLSFLFQVFAIFKEIKFNKK